MYKQNGFPILKFRKKNVIKDIDIFFIFDGHETGIQISSSLYSQLDFCLFLSHLPSYLIL